MCQSTLRVTHRDPVTVGQCGVSEVNNDINTVQFLAQTDRIVSLNLNVSSRAAGFNLGLFTLYLHFII